MAAAKKRAKPRTAPGANWDTNRKVEPITSEREAGPGIEQTEEEREYRRNFGADSPLAQRARDIGKGMETAGEVIQDVSCVGNVCFLNIAGAATRVVGRAEALRLLEKTRAVNAERTVERAVEGGAKAEARAVRAEAKAAERAEANAASKAERAEANTASKAERDLCSCCFLAGTPILTNHGFKAIEDIRNGDLVASKDEVSGATGFKPVTALIETRDKAVFELTLSDGQGTEVLTVTDNHPFWVLNKASADGKGTEAGWVDSGQLKAGMQVVTHAGHELAVLSLVPKNRVVPTYNFTVADFHTYFVGHAKVWVHNCECGEAARGRLRIDPNGTFSKSEIEAAWHMAAQGKSVVLRSPSGTRAAGGTSDLLVDGVRYDVYTPTTSNANRIVSAIARKNSQAEGIVLDLSGSSVTRDQLGNLLRRVNGAGAANIRDIVILEGR